MIFIHRKFLTIYETNNPVDKICLPKIENMLISRANNTIYFVANKKLYGLVTTGDITKSIEMDKQEVSINKNFTRVQENKYLIALKIFKENNKINSLPIVNKEGNIVGEYNRFDESLTLALDYGLDRVSLYQIARYFKKIAVFLPDNSPKCKSLIAKRIKNRFTMSNIEAVVLSVSEILNKYDDYDTIMTLDKDDYYSIGSIFRINKLDVELSKRKTFLETIEMAEILESIEETIQAARNGGIEVINLFFGEESQYAQNLLKEIRKKYQLFDINPDADTRVLPEISQNFFGKLNNEEYRRHVGTDDDLVLYMENGIPTPKDFSGTYKNYKNGERKTQNQPKNARKTIYFFGPCFIRGAYVEDKDTIPSIVQGMLNQSEYNIKVVNYGGFGIDHLSSVRKMRFRINDTIRSGDIIVTFSENHIINGIKNIDLMDVLEKKKPQAGWFTDHWKHCNYKINRIYANAIFDALIDCISYNKASNSNLEHKLLDLFFIDKYFEGVKLSDYKSIGSIVMNCNPFTLGHRYLIEQSKKLCDLLIVFVVSEDKSLFSFNSRLAMVKMGTKDLTNVIVCPSGYNILSSNNFPEYFVKTIDDDVSKNAENDIEIFAQDVASRLNITKRFVGEELTDPVTAHYNDAMKKILPKYGIELVEITRKKINEKAISATLVRECLELNNMERLKNLVPQTTIDVIFEEMK